MLEIKYNSSRKCACLVGDHVDIVREHFSVPNKGAFFAKRLGYRNISSRNYIITASGNFGIGLVPRIEQFCKEQNIPYNIDNEIQTLLTPGIYKDILYTVSNANFKLRDYQEQCIIKTLKYGKGLIKVGTGGGKTLITSTIIENFYKHFNNSNFKCLMIVPDLGLVNQTYDEFKKFGTSFTISKFTGNNELNLNCNCIIANSQILLQLDKNEKWIKNIDLLIVDEVHKIKKGNKITQLVSKIKTHHRIGCTGTLPTDNLDLWNLISNFGDVIYEKPSIELRNENYLTNAKVHMLQLNYNEKVNREYREELEFLMENKGRNEIISKICGKCKNNILVLVNFIKHGEILYELLKNLPGKQVYFVQGSVDAEEERPKIIKAMEENDNVVCIAISAIFSTGINIKNLHTMIFAAGGKSAIRVIQSIGRGLRLHQSKSIFNIIDLADQLKYGIQHAEERLKIYKNEVIDVSVKSIQVNS